MYLSLSTWLFEHLDVAEMVRHVRRCGYENVELSGSRAHARWNMAELQRVCADAGVTVTSVHCDHHSKPELEDDDAGYEAYHDEFYERIGGFTDVVVIEHIRFDAAVANRTHERLLYLADKCARLGFTLSTENMPDRNSAQWDILRRVLNGPVYLTLDGKHAAAAGVDPLAYFEFADRIVNVHALDHYAGAPLGDWLPVGSGAIDWAAILARLRDIGYAGRLTVELNERRLRDVLEAVTRVCSLADLPDGHLALLDDARLEDVFAIASRRRLEELLAELWPPAECSR